MRNAARKAGLPGMATRYRRLAGDERRIATSHLLATRPVVGGGGDDTSNDWQAARTRY